MNFILKIENLVYPRYGIKELTFRKQLVSMQKSINLSIDSGWFCKYLLSAPYSLSWDCVAYYFSNKLFYIGLAKYEHEYSFQNINYIVATGYSYYFYYGWNKLLFFNKCS